MDLTFLFSSIAIILSLASVILVAIRIGISIGFEFVEKKEIRDMKTKIDKTLRTQWEAELTEFFNRSVTSIKKHIDEEFIKEITNISEAVRYLKTATSLLKILSKLSTDIVKGVVGVIILSVLFSIDAWAIITNPNLISIAGPLGTGILLGLIIAVYATIKRTRGYMSLRSQFYELHDTPTLEKAKEIMIELERREIII